MSLKPAAFAAAAAVALTAVAVPAVAQPYGDYDRYDRYERGYDGYDRRGDRYYGDDDGYRGRRWDRYDGRGRHESCRDQRRRGAVTGGILGAIAGGVIGSNVDEDGNRGDGTAIGAILGGVVGSQIGRASADCDAYGYYYRYDQTYPYRVSDRYRGGRYDGYRTRGCRLAVVDRGYGRGEYVTVCPDRYGRFRVAY